MLMLSLRKNSNEGINLIRNLKIFLVSTLSAKMNNEYKVIHDAEKKEFNIPCGTEKAVLQYEIIDQKTGAVDLLHTEVPSELRGKGIAKILAKEALDHFANKDVPFKLTCWYLQKYFDENKKPEYERNILK